MRKEPEQRVVRQGCSGMMFPGAPPDHNTSCDDRQTISNEHQQPDIGHTQAYASGEEDGDKIDGT